MPDEQIFHATAGGLYRQLGSKDMKGEFVVVVDGRKLDKRR
jgi:16S rRNA C1402 (ribose-2'-O) methylase RsmI